MFLHGIGRALLDPGGLGWFPFLADQGDVGTIIHDLVELSHGEMVHGLGNLGDEDDVMESCENDNAMSH